MSGETLRVTRWCARVGLLIVLGGCGGGSGPGIAPADDGAGPMDIPQQGPDGDEGSEATQTCLSDADCDDKDPCTQDTCAADGCRHEPLSSGACDDGDPCTVGEACQNGVCGGGDFVCECKDDTWCPPASDDCHVNVCDLSTHECIEQSRKDGTPCDDADPCTNGEACWDGKCQGGADVCPCEKDDECPAPSDPCSPYRCDPVDHMCRVDPKADGTPCDDGDPCTLQDQCQTGKCTPGPAKDCNDQDGCTADSCDKTTGECKNEFVPQFGCCQSDAECDDGDACTVETCEEHRCVHSGEKAGSTGVGCAVVTGCDVGVCGEDTGKCRSLRLDMPAPLFDWDLTTEARPKGMRWLTGTGTLTTAGAGPGPGEEVALFAFPAHFVPAGIRVLWLTLGPDLDCGAQAKVLVRVDGNDPVGASGCATENGRAVLGFVMQSATASRLDLAVLVQAGARVARATLYQYAIPSCRPLQPVIAVTGTGHSDLSVAASRTTFGVGHRFQGEVIRFGRYTLGEAVKTLTTWPGKWSLTARHRTTVLPIAGARYLFAFDGIPGEGKPSTILVSLHNEQGENLSEAPVPGKSSDSGLYEPFLTAMSSGRVFLTYSSSDADADGLGVRFVEVLTTGDQIAFGSAVTVNSDIAGDQSQPVLSWSGDTGIVMWKSWKTGMTSPSSLHLRKITLSGPQGPEHKVLESSDIYQSLAVIPSGDYYLVAATTSDGALKGYRVLANFSETTPWGGVPGVGEWSDVTLLPAQNGALLVGTYLKGASASIVYAKVSQQGFMGDIATVWGPVNLATANPTLGDFGPFLHLVAFHDTLSASKGSRVALLSGRCADGPVTCKGNIARVCTGLGGTGYASVPWTEAWCE